MLRRVTWKLWAGVAAILVSYAVLGHWYDTNGTVEFQTYKWGLLVDALAPLVFVTCYTLSGDELWPPSKWRPWWRNDLGTRLVLIACAQIPLSGVLAITFWFFHGILTTSALAWIEVGSPAASGLLLLWQSFAFLRIAREVRLSGVASTSQTEISALLAEIDSLRAENTRLRAS